MTQDEAIQLLKMGYNVFLTGAPGSGKTFLLNKYITFKKEKLVTIIEQRAYEGTHDKH